MPSRRLSLCWPLLLLLIPHLILGSDVDDGMAAYRAGDFESAFPLLAQSASADTPGLQNIVALMLYHGRGTPPDPAAAHDLFHSAAMGGSIMARRNLGILHTLGAPGVEINFDEARIWFATAQATGNIDRPSPDQAAHEGEEALIAIDGRYNGNGKKIYLTFCSGCHGFSGMNFFKYAPSFAMGQRLTKSDAELMEVIQHGKGMMPSWEDKLPLSDLEDALLYLRFLAIQTAYGMDATGFNEEPEMYFIFYPWSGEQGDIISPHASTEDDY